jgi:hypothetical protein
MHILYIYIYMRTSNTQEESQSPFYEKFEIIKPYTNIQLYIINHHFMKKFEIIKPYTNIQLYIINHHFMKMFEIIKPYTNIQLYLHYTSTAIIYSGIHYKFLAKAPQMILAT